MKHIGRLLVLALLVTSILVLRQVSANGRYRYLNQNGAAYLLDTKTGAVYVYRDHKWSVLIQKPEMEAQ